MANEATRLLAKHLRTLSTAARAENVPDSDFLQRFAAQRDEEAFATLVRRHGPMVLRVCQRVLHDVHAAEDAFQAAFLLLSRKAASLRRADSVGCWLHSVAYRLALKARTQLARQRRPDVRGTVENPIDDPLAQLTVREAQAIVDEELTHLPEKYRAPLVLCYLEGKTRDEAARQLGWSAKLVKSRLEQGRERLRYRLSRRGLTLPAALVATLLVEEAAPAALPAALLRAAVQTAIACPTHAVSARVAVLAEGALRGSGSVKAKIVVGLLLLMGVLAAGAGAYAPHPVAEAPPPVANAPGSSAAKQPEKPQAAQTMRVVVLDPQGKPLPDAKVHSGIWTHEKGFKSNHDYKTDADGGAQVELPKSYYIVRLWVSKKRFVTLFANWEQNELASGTKLPAEYTFRLEPGVTAGGRIVDDQGKPIAGAKVQVQLAGKPKPAHGDGRTNYTTWLADGSDSATTDAEGRWRIDNVPDNPRVELSLLVSHPDYVSHQFWGEGQKAAGITTAMLRKGTATLTLRNGVIVRGRVTDPAGKPIKDAVVVEGNNPYDSWLPRKFATDADGRFRLPALALGETTLTVIAPGWAPQLRLIKLQAELPPQDFHMAPGKPIRLRIVDAAGKPVPNAFVHILSWKGSQSLYWDHNPNHPKVPDTKVPQRANADGVWEWKSAPDDAVKVRIWSQGFAARELEIAGGAAERTVVLKPDHRITGRVTDAATGKPIPSFTVIQLDVFRKDWFVAERGHAVAGKNGRLDYLADRTDIPLRLRIEAPGYRTQDGPEFRVGDDMSRTQDFRLQPSPPIAGVVHDAAGKPAAKAKVLLATPTEDAQLQSSWDNNHKTFTDAAGHFTFPDPGEPCVVIAQADAGFALAEFPAGQHDVGALRLRPWASIRGQFRDGGQPVRGATIFLNLVRLDTLDRPRIHTVGMQTVTGADGRFEFPRVPPVPVSVRVHLGPWKDEGYRSGPSVPLDLQPGQKAELGLGGGSSIKGKVKLTGKVPADLDCTYSLNYLVPRAPGIAPPPDIARLGFDARNGWQDSWSQTPEGLAYLSTLRHWFVKLAPDGAFRISGVPAGEYDLAVAVYAKPDG
jgi:RNA polymerase sigma factor (sigma-70 family)